MRALRQVIAKRAPDRVNGFFVQWKFAGDPANPVCSEELSQLGTLYSVVPQRTGKNRVIRGSGDRVIGKPDRQNRGHRTNRWDGEQRGACLRRGRIRNDRDSLAGWSEAT